MKAQNDKFAHLPLFDQPFYAEITTARLNHLSSLGLEVEGKRVIDIGAGIGRLAQFFVERNCDVLCIDGREDNIALMREHYPSLEGRVHDVESEDLLSLGTFDVVFCYGLLYHLTDPFGFLKRATGICRETLILETKISDFDEPTLLLVEEYEDPTMGLNDFGTRPSSSYVAACLGMCGFKHVYSPVELPEHEDFRYKVRNDGSHLRGGVPMRNIFVASNMKLDLPSLRRWETAWRPRLV